MNNRLGKDDYDRPKKTKQDKLSAAEIKEMLESYVEVEDISKVPLNTHLRYFTEKKNEKTGKKEKVFRMGGFLVNKNNYDKYVVLATAPNLGYNNNSKTWSANTKTSKFYRKLSFEEMKEQYEDEIDELYEQIDLLKKENKKLKGEVKKYKKKNTSK